MGNGAADHQKFRPRCGYTAPGDFVRGSLMFVPVGAACGPVHHATGRTRGRGERRREPIGPATAMVATVAQRGSCGQLISVTFRPTSRIAHPDFEVAPYGADRGSG